MKLLSAFNIATSSIWQNKLRNSLTILGIIIGIGSVISILAVGNGIKETILHDLQQSNSQPQIQLVSSADYDLTTFFSNEDLQLITSVPGVTHAKLTSVDSLVEATANFGGEKKSVNINLVNTASSGLLSNDIYISDHLYKKLHLNKSHTKAILIGMDYFPIKQVLTDNNSLLNNGDVTMLSTSYTNHIGSIPGQDTVTLTLNNNWHKSNVINNVVAKLNRSGSKKNVGKYTAVNNTSFLTSITKIVNYITYFIAFVAGISLFIAGVGIMNTMYMTVSERTKEIGIRRAVGATKNDIRVQFLIESAVLSLVGGILGIILGVTINAFMNQFLPFHTVMRPSFVIIACLVSISIGLTFGLVPANKAANKNLIDIL